MTFMLESRIILLFLHQFYIALQQSRKAFSIWMVLPKTLSTPPLYSTPRRRAPFLLVAISNRDRPDTRQSWVTSWLVPVSAWPQLSPTTTRETMMARTSPKTTASSQRRSLKEVSLMMLSSPTLFSTLRATTTLITKLSSSTSPLLVIPRELLTSTPHRSSLAVLTRSHHTTSARIPSSPSPSWLTCLSLVKYLQEFKLITRPSDPSFRTCRSSSRRQLPTTPSTLWTALLAREWPLSTLWKLRPEFALTTRPSSHSTSEQVLNIVSEENEGWT